MEAGLVSFDSRGYKCSEDIVAEVLYIGEAYGLCRREPAMASAAHQPS